jgi:uncharacterized protein with HEPN domain
MSGHDVRKLLYDIEHAALRIGEFLAGTDRDGFLGSTLMQSAVERQFEIIGEALGQALEIDPSVHDSISQSRRIVAFRNRLIHGYSSISARVVWDVVQKDLPVLLREAKALSGRTEPLTGPGTGSGRSSGPADR